MTPLARWWYNLSLNLGSPRRAAANFVCAEFMFTPDREALLKACLAEVASMRQRGVTNEAWLRGYLDQCRESIETLCSAYERT